MIVNDSAECPLCSLGPPPDTILWLPPPPVPAFLVHSSDYYSSDGLPFFEHFNSSPCKHSCEWRAEGVQYVEMPQQGTLFDDTWLLVLISSCIGIVFIGIILATLLIKCLYGMPVRGASGGTLRPRVSSPTRIEHPNLPPLNLQPLRKQPSRANPHTSECTLLRGGMASSGYIPTI